LDWWCVCSSVRFAAVTCSWLVEQRQSKNKKNEWTTLVVWKPRLELNAGQKVRRRRCHVQLANTSSLAHWLHVVYVFQSQVNSGYTQTTDHYKTDRRTDLRQLTSVWDERWCSVVVDCRRCRLWLLSITTHTHNIIDISVHRSINQLIAFRELIVLCGLSNKQLLQVYTCSHSVGRVSVFSQQTLAYVHSKVSFMFHVMSIYDSHLTV